MKGATYGIVVLLLLGMEVSTWANTPEVSPFPEAELKQDPRFDEATYEKLQNRSVEVSWDKEDLAAVLMDLTAQTKKADPAHTGIKFVLEPAGTPGNQTGVRKISVLLMGVPVLTVLEYLSQQVSFKILVEKDSVLVRPGP